MESTCVIEIFCIEEQVFLDGVKSSVSELTEVFDCKSGATTLEICQNALERCSELNEMYGNSNRKYITNRID